MTFRHSSIKLCTCKPVYIPRNLCTSTIDSSPIGHGRSDSYFTLPDHATGMTLGAYINRPLWEKTTIVLLIFIVIFFRINIFITDAADEVSVSTEGMTYLRGFIAFYLKLQVDF